jgi:hypothetical protein
MRRLSSIRGLLVRQNIFTSRTPPPEPFPPRRICGEQGANTLQGLTASRVLACGVAMVAKLLLLVALLAPVLTVAAGILAHRDKRSKRDAREDRKST